MTDIENPIRLKMDLQEAALVLQSMRHPILSQAILQAIKLIDVLSGDAAAREGVEIGALDIDGPGVPIDNFPRPVMEGLISISSGPWPEMFGDLYDRQRNEKFISEQVKIAINQLSDRIEKALGVRP